MLKLNVVTCCLMFNIISTSGELQVQSVIKCIETPPKASQNFILKFLLCTSCVCEALVPYSYISTVELEILISVYTDCKHRIANVSCGHKYSIIIFFSKILCAPHVVCTSGQLSVEY